MYDNEMTAAWNARSRRLAALAASGTVRIADAMDMIDPQLVAGLAAWPSPRRAMVVAKLLRASFEELLPWAPRPDAPAVFALLVTAGAAGVGNTEIVEIGGDTLTMRVTTATIGGTPGVDLAWGDGLVGFPDRILGPSSWATARTSVEAAEPSGPLTVAELLEDGRGRRVPLARLRAATGLGLLLNLGTWQDQVQISRAEGRTTEQREALALLAGRVIGQNATTTQVVDVPGLADPREVVLVFNDGDAQLG